MRKPNVPGPDTAPAADTVIVDKFSNAVTSRQPASTRINPFTHVGSADWGKGGHYVVGADGIRRPA